MSGELKLKTRYFVTTRTVKVLSQCHDAGTPSEAEEASLADLHYLVHEGHCVCHSDSAKSEEVTPMEMANLLYDAGSEPGFFSLDDEGKPTDA